MKTSINLLTCVLILTLKIFLSNCDSLDKHIDYVYENSLSSIEKVISFICPGLKNRKDVSSLHLWSEESRLWTLVDQKTGRADYEIQLDDQFLAQKSIVFICRIRSSMPKKSPSWTTTKLQYFRGNTNLVAKDLIYQSKEVRYQKVNLGDDVILNCPPHADGEETVWRKPVQFRIVSQRKIRGSRLFLTEVKPSDLGTYYCGYYQVESNQQTYIKAYAIILDTHKINPNHLQEKLLVPEESSMILPSPYLHTYRCPRNNTNPTSFVEWEDTNGRVLLTPFQTLKVRKMNIYADNTIPLDDLYYCRVNEGSVSAHSRIKRMAKFQESTEFAIGGGGFEEDEKILGGTGKDKTPPPDTVEEDSINLGGGGLHEETVTVSIDLREFRVRADKSDLKIKCNVTVKGGTLDPTSIKWEYSSTTDAGKFTTLPEGVNAQYDANTQTSVLKFSSTKVSQSGVYQCSYKEKNRDQSKINIYNIRINPIEARVRLGQSVRFLCIADESYGATKVFWTRQDRRDFIERERQQGDNGKSVLVVNNVEWEDNKTIYVCNYRDLTKTTKLIIDEVCGDGQKKCKNGQCKRAVVFCDGKPDCEDGSDEIKEICDRCEPNEYSCKPVNGTNPRSKCYLRHWHCDGDQDCGNGYDELDCPFRNKNKCQGTHYMCNDNSTIPRAYWCDQERDCFAGDDEAGCRDPVFTYPTEDTGRVLSVQTNKTITIMCKVSSRPLATIIWRFNWGHMPEDANYTIEQTFEGCDRTVSILTIYNAMEVHSGIYTCEANAKKRAMGEDYHLLITNNVNKCEKPYFNDAAFFKEECLRCFCFNRTNECSSLKEYEISSVPKSSSTMENDFDVTDYKVKKILEKSRSSNFWSPTRRRYIIDSVLYNDIKSPDLFLRGTFGMSGSWLMSYGQTLRYTLTLKGKSVGVFQGPLLVLYGNSDTIYRCRPPNRRAIYAEENYLDNLIEVKLIESDNWFNRTDCTGSVTRDQMMRVLSNVNQLAIRIKYYQEQTNFEMTKLSLEFAKPSSWKNNFLAFIESCKCPKGYEGHSCERCSFNYRRTADNRCEPICNCAKCDENGDCIKCTGNADGPRCLQCKSGFYRDPNLPLSADCKPCNCPRNESLRAKVSNECEADPRSNQEYKCRCPPGLAQSLECINCSNESNPEQCEKTKKLSECSSVGTQIVSGGKCICNPGYEGPTCTECQKKGYFKLNNRCRKCYCSGNTTECTLATNYHFVTVAQQNKESAYGYGFTYSLGRRYLDGVYKVQNGKDYMKISDNLIQLETSKLPGALFLMISIQSNKEYRNGLYGLLYGGEMSFNLEPVLLKLNLTRNPEITPVVEIMTPKFSRIWTKPVFDKINKRYQLVFDEAYWYSWSDLSNKNIDRETLLKSLMTAQNIALVFSTKPGSLENLRLTNLKLEVAEAREEGQPAPSGSRPAPVEKCRCGPNSEALGLSCEGCADPNYQSVVSIRSNRDFECGKCIKNCKVCNKGSYKYDFLLDQTYATCQPGLTIDPPARVIDLNVGERLEIPCRVKSFRGGAPIHRWVKVNQDGSTSNQQLTYERDYMGDDISEARLVVDNIQISDEGVYRCEAWNLVSDINAEYYVKVNDRDPRFSIKINVDSIKPDRPKEIDINGNIKVKGPSNDYQFIWTNLNGTKVKTRFNVKPDYTGGPFKMTISMENEKDNNIRFQIIGSNPSKPYYYVYEQDKIPRIPEGEPDYSSLYVDKQELTINFLDGGRFRLMNPKDLPIKVRWYKENYKDNNGRSFPIGISQRGSDLVIYSGGENHNGNYIVEITDPNTNKVVKTIKVRLNVGDMMDQKQTNMNNKTRNLEEYFPPPEYCPVQKWILVSKNTGQRIDISNKIVAQGNDSRSFIVNAPILSDSTIEFTCNAVPKANLSGKVEVSLNKREPRIKIEAIYGNDQSPYPTRITCTDENRDELSEITWSTNARDPMKIEERSNLNSVVFKEFKPYKHEGKYTCTAENKYATKSKTVSIPGFDEPTKEFPTQIEIYSKDRKVTNVKMHKGGRIELVCQTIGSPKPYNDITWKFKPLKKMGNTLYPISKVDAPRQGIHIKNPDSCYSILTIPEYDMSAHAGDYYCLSDFKGKPIEAKVTVEEIKAIDVIVGGLKGNSMNGYENGEQYLYCITTKVSTVPLVYRWEFRTPDDELVNKSILAEDVKESESKLSLINLKALKDRKISGQCVVTLDNRDYYSKPFDVKIFLSHIYAPVLDISVEYKKNKDGINVPSKITCKNKNSKAKSNVTLTFEGSSSMPPKTVGDPSSQSAEMIFQDFSVADQSGYYVCTAINPYAKATKSVLLPSYKNPTDTQPPRVRLYSVPPLEKAPFDNSKYIHQVGIKVKFLCEVYGKPQPTHVAWNLRKPRPITDTVEPRTNLDLNNPAYARGNGFEVSQKNPYLAEAYFNKDSQGLGDHDIKCTATNDHGSDSDEMIVVDPVIPREVTATCKSVDSSGKYKDDDCTDWVVNKTDLLECSGTDIRSTPEGHRISQTKPQNPTVDWIFRDTNEKKFKPEDVGIKLKQIERNDDDGKKKDLYARKLFELTHSRKLPSYKIQCRMSYNESYSAYSSSIEIKFPGSVLKDEIRKSEFMIISDNNDPKFVDMTSSNKIHPIVYDSSRTMKIVCISEGRDGIRTHVWHKCLAKGEKCIAAKVSKPESDTISLNNIETKYTDKGIYGCKINSIEGGFEEEKWKFVNISIYAKPNIHYMESKVLFAPETIEVPCIEESASPPARIDWTFRPYSLGEELPFQAVPQGTETQTVLENRKVILRIPKEQMAPRFNGEYKCTATNEFGSVERTFFLSLRKEGEKTTLPQIGYEFDLVLPPSTRILRAVQSSGGRQETILISLIRLKPNLWIYKIDPNEKFEIRIQIPDISSAAKMEYTWFKCFTKDCVSKTLLKTSAGVLILEPNTLTIKDTGIYEFLLQLKLEGQLIDEKLGRLHLYLKDAKPKLSVPQNVTVVKENGFSGTCEDIQGIPAGKLQWNLLGLTATDLQPLPKRARVYSLGDRLILLRMRKDFNESDVGIFVCTGENTKGSDMAKWKVEIQKGQPMASPQLQGFSSVISLAIRKLEPEDGITLSSPYTYTIDTSKRAVFKCEIFKGRNPVNDDWNFQWEKCLDERYCSRKELANDSNILTLPADSVMQTDLISQDYRCVAKLKKGPLIRKMKLYLKKLISEDDLVRQLSIFKVKPASNFQLTPPYAYAYDVSKGAEFECRGPSGEGINYKWNRCKNKKCTRTVEVSESALLKLSGLETENQLSESIQYECVVEKLGSDHWIKKVNLHLTAYPRKNSVRLNIIKLRPNDGFSMQSPYIYFGGVASDDFQFQCLNKNGETDDVQWHKCDDIGDNCSPITPASPQLVVPEVQFEEDQVTLKQTFACINTDGDKVRLQIYRKPDPVARIFKMKPVDNVMFEEPYNFTVNPSTPAKFECLSPKSDENIIYHWILCEDEDCLEEHELSPNNEVEITHDNTFGRPNELRMKIEVRCTIEIPGKNEIQHVSMKLTKAGAYAFRKRLF